MACPYLAPRLPQRAGDIPGDRSGLSCARLDPANHRPPEPFRRGSRTVVARGSPPCDPHHRDSVPVRPRSPAVLSSFPPVQSPYRRPGPAV